MQTIKYFEFFRFFKFNFIKKFLRILFLLITIVLFTIGFFISSARAEEVTLIIPVEYKVIDGIDTTGGVSSIFSISDINSLSGIDGDRIRNEGVSWPKGESYDEEMYMEFIFSSDVPPNALIEEVKILNNFRRSGALDGVKLEIWNGESFVDEFISKGPNTTTDNQEEVDITSYINTPDLVNNLIVRFLAYRSGTADTKTSHDYIGIFVTYSLGDDTPMEHDLALFTEIGGMLSEDIHLTKDLSPYVVTEDLYIADGKILTIDPGVILKFESGTSLVIEGNIQAIGTEDDPIYFTSYADDTRGGDTNDDDDETLPSDSDWGYIILKSSDGESVFENVFETYSRESLMSLEESSFKLSNYSGDRAVLMFGGNAVLDNVDINSLELYEGAKVVGDHVNVVNGDDYVILLNESSLSLKNSNINGMAERLISIYNNSSLVFENVNIKGDMSDSYNSAISVYDQSYIEMRNVLMDDIYDAVIIYDNSSFIADDLTLSCEGEGILVYGDSSLSLTKGDISCSDKGVYVYMGSEASINESKISGSGMGIMAHQNLSIDAIKINKTEISDNNIGVLIFYSDILANQNSIHDNKSFGVMTYDSNPLSLYNYNFTSNFWGDKTGPTHSSNASGLGDSISDGIIYSPFLPSNPLINTRNPVILIPGITASYLNRDYGDKSEIWPDLGKLMISPDDSFLNDLSLNPDGTENIEYPIIAGDIIRRMVTVDVFDGLIDELTNAGYIEGTDLFVFPYDWRFSTESISRLLKEKIELVTLTTGQDKVDIVAHSMGGLVAKKYIADNGGDNIDQLIFLGTPQLGAPKAFKVLMYGDHMGYQALILLGLNRSRAKFISQNMPSVYELLPSNKYLNLNGEYIENSLDEDNPIELDYTSTKNFLVDNGRNTQMFPFAESLHDSVDYLNLSNIKSYNFVGCGSPTIGSIKIEKEDSWIGNLFNKKEDYKIGYTDGDKTVPLISADKTIGSEIYYVNGIGHESLPSASGVRENILALLNNGELTFEGVFKDNYSSCGIEGDVVSTHSPVILHIYDEGGNHTGPNENGDIEYGIDGVEYDVIEDVNYAFLPKGNNYKIVTIATDIGGFSLKVEEQKGDDVLETHDWVLIPQPSLLATGEMWIGPDYLSDNYNFKIDNDGDGDFETNYLEGFDGTRLAEQMTKKQEKTRSSHIIGSTPKKEKSDSQGGPNFVDNIKITKEEKFIPINNKHEELDTKVVIKSQKNNDNENIEDRIIIKDNLMASAGLIDVNTKSGLLFTIIGGGILVLLLAIRFVIKLK